MADVWRGYAIELDRDGVWLYVDTQRPVSDDPERMCGYCRMSNNEVGHDACLGTLPNVINACCGHGREKEAYVQLINGEVMSGSEAVRLQQQLRASFRRRSSSSSTTSTGMGIETGD